VSSLYPGRAEAQWDGRYFPNVPLITHEGETVNFYDDLLDGKIVVVSFVYTDCPDICGLSTARLAQMVEWLGDRIGRDIFVYSISIDPEKDTPERLAAFRQAFGAPEGWTFLTGDREDIDLVRWKLGERSRSLAEHRSDMVIGNAATGEWRRSSVMGSLVVATQDVLALDPDWRASPPQAQAGQPSGQRGAYIMRDTRGEGLFISACAACHTIGEGLRVGPDLAGVTLRREHDWLVRFLRAPDAMLAQGDPITVELNQQFSSVRMPNLGLGEADAEDLIHYLASQTDLLGASVDAEDAAITVDGEPDHSASGHQHGNHDHAAHDHDDEAHSSDQDQSTGMLHHEDGAQELQQPLSQ
jgi:protein SCO1